MQCPKCGSTELETITDEFTMGVEAPDGSRAIGREEIVRCQSCGSEYDFDDNALLSEAERRAEAMNAKYQIEGGDCEYADTFTLEELFDGISDEESFWPRADIAGLNTGESLNGGGGAAPIVTVTRIV